jgi:hypothetical protein
MQSVQTLQAYEPKLCAIERHFQRGEMTEAEAKILVMLAEHRGILGGIQEDLRIVKGTNGTPPLATRLDRIEQRASVAQRLKMHAVTTTIGVVIAIAVGFVIVKPPSPAEQRQIEELQQQNAQLKIEVENLKKVQVAAPVDEPAQTIKVPQRNKPRRPPGPPLGPGAAYKNGDVIANPNLDYPLFSSHRPTLPMMEFPR